MAIPSHRLGSPLSATSSAESSPAKTPQRDSSTSATKIVALPEDDDLLCTICKEYPSKEVLQCPEGHLFCPECFEKMVNPRAICAVCRCDVTAQKPIRNRLAEKKILDLPTLCKYASKGCAIQLTRATIADHENRNCLYRPASCAAASVGCSWSGTIHDERIHEKSCRFYELMPVLQAWQTKFHQRTRQLENEVRDRLAALEPKMQNCTTLLAKMDPRAAETIFLRVFDFRLRESPGPYGHVQTFMAFGHIWEIHLTPKNDAVGLRMKHVQESGSAPPQGADVHRSLGVFTISVTAIHPGTGELEVGFKYHHVELSHARYLDEQLWLPAPQLTRHFISPATGVLRLRCKMRKHISGARSN